MSFAKEFARQREKLKLTQDELGKIIGVSRAYVTLIENGKRLPGKKQLINVANALKLKKQVVINWYLQEMRDKLI
jgi:transcriptional regulator with XRE-family HTH domain